MLPDLFNHLLPRGISHSVDSHHQIECLGSQLIQPFLYAGGHGHLVPIAFQRCPPGHHSARVIDEENSQTFGEHLETSSLNWLPPGVYDSFSCDTRQWPRHCCWTAVAPL